jgi:RHS repeat-associated protein
MAAVSGSPALAYNSDSFSPAPIVEISYASDPNGTVPTSIKAQLTWNNGTPQTAVTFSTTGHSAGDVYLLDLQDSSAVTFTSAFPWSVTVTAAYSGGVNVVRTVSGKTPVIVNGTASPYGPGWSLASVDQLVTVGNDLMWVHGGGEARYFQSLGNNAYLSPANDFGTLVKNVGGTYTYTAKDQTKFNFDSSGNISTIVDPHNLTLTYAYSSGLLSTVTEPDGGVGTFTYASGLLTNVTEPGGRTVTLTYASGYLSTIQDPDAGIETFGYDTSHRLNNDQHGPLNATLTYDTTSGEPNNINLGLSDTVAVAPANSVGLATSPAKNAGAAVGVLTDGLSHPATYTLDGMGRTTKLQTADGATQSWLRDAAGQPTTYTDPLNHVTTSTFDYNTGKGDLTQVTYPDGSTQQFQYDGTFHNMTVSVDGNGNRTTMAYDATTGDLTTLTNALNQTTTYAYLQTGGRSNGLLQSTTDALGNVTSYAYDSNRRQTTVVEGYGTAVATTATMIYDTAGNLSSETSGISSTVAYDHHTTTSYAYDGLRRETQLIEAYGTTLQRTTTTLYDAIGDVLSVTDPAGHIVSYAYDQVGRQTTEIDAYGTAIATTGTMIYDNAGNLLSLTTGSSTTTSYDHHATTSYGYDALNRQNQVISGYGAPEASTTTMAFDLAGNLTSETQGYSSTSTYTHATTATYAYDVMNRQTGVTQGAGSTVAVTATMAYDLAGNLVSETDSISTTSASYDHHVVTSFAYDALNRQIGKTDAVGVTGLVRSSSTAFDAAGNVLSTTDALGHISSYAYNALNQKTTEIDAYSTPVAVTGTMAYDAAGNLLSETTGQSTTSTYDHSATTSYAYDALNEQTQVIQGYGNQFATTGTMIYDKVGNLLSETTGYSVTTSYDHHTTTSYGYDALNRRTSEIDGYGTAVARTLATTYDAAGEVQVSFDALNNATTMTHDALGRETQVQDPAGYATTVYDAASNVVNTIDANNNKSTFSYDSLNRQTAATDPRGGITTSVFDAASNKVNLIDSDANKTTFSFDTLNRLTQQTDPLGKSATFAYSATDHLTSTTDRDNRVDTFSYDALDREIGATWKNSTGSTVNTLTYTLDAAGEQLTASDNNGTYTMAYDQLNRLTSEQEPYSQILTFTYDAASNRATRSDSQSGVATETYDALNRLVSYQYAVSGVATLSLYQTWTKRDQLATQSRYSDLTGTNLVGTTSYGYDAAARETNLQFKDGSGNSISNFTYSYDPGNRLTAETLAVATLSASTTSYQYNADSELTQSGSLTYGYDATGNRNNTGYTTGTGNQLTNDGTWTYTYDSEGDLQKKSKGSLLETWTYGYDNLNHLAWAEDRQTDGGSLITRMDFKYDVFGDRIDQEVTANSTTTATHFAYDGQNAWADLSGANALQTRRLYTDAVDALFARISSGGTAAWYLADRLGSVRDIANNTTGASIDHLDYDGFGNASETQSGNGDRYKFTAREFDAVMKLQYNRGRYYDPVTGRWTSQDLLGFNAGDSNLYRYVQNNPTNATDPSGLDSVNVEVPASEELGVGAATLKLRFWNPDDFKPGQMQTVIDVHARLYQALDRSSREVGYLRNLWLVSSFRKDGLAGTLGPDTLQEKRAFRNWRNCLDADDTALFKGLEKWFGALDEGRLVQIANNLEACRDFITKRQITYKKVNTDAYVVYADGSKAIGNWFLLYKPFFKKLFRVQVGIMVHETVHLALWVHQDFILNDPKDPSQGYWDEYDPKATTVSPTKDQLLWNPDTYKGFVMDRYIP